MRIILYQNFAEREVIDKRSYIIIADKIDGVFRDSVDFISPVIRIELTQRKEYFTRFNYVYIEVLNKYYFVDNIVIVRSNENDNLNIRVMYDVYLTEDVLTTFISTIFPLEVAVNRQEFQYNEYLKDNLLPCSVVPTIEEYELTSPQPKGTNVYNYILTVAAGFFETSDEYKPTNQNPNAVYSDSYMFTQDQIMTFGRKLMGGSINLADLFSMLFNDPSQGVINLTLLPFEIKNNIDVKSVSITTINIGKGFVTEVPCRAIYDTKYINKKIGEFTIQSKYNNFLDYSPYTTIEMYLPFYGFIDIDPNLILDKTCEIYYVIDMVTGSCKIKIIDSTTKNIYYTVNCQVGIQISMTSSNIAEKIRNIATTAISIGASVVGLGTASSLSALNAPRMYTPRTGRITKAYAKYSASEDLKTTQRNANFVSETTSDIVSAMQNHIKSGAASNEITEWEYFDTSSTSTYNFKVYWRVRRVTPITIDNYNKLIGKPSAISGVVRNFLGYTEISACHFENLYSCLNNEIDMIEDYFRNGIIINNTHKLSIQRVKYKAGSQTIPFTDFYIICDNRMKYRVISSSNQDIYVNSSNGDEYIVGIYTKDTTLELVVQDVSCNGFTISFEPTTSPTAGIVYFKMKVNANIGNTSNLELQVLV